MNKGEAALIIVIGLLFIGCVLVVSDLQTKEEAPELVIINETYEPKQIYGRPIEKNLTTKMRVEPLN